MMNRRNLILAVSMLAIAGVLAACASPAPAATPTALPTAAIEATVASTEPPAATAPGETPTPENPAAGPTVTPPSSGVKIGAPEGAIALEHSPEYDAIVNGIVAEQGFDKFVYEAYQLPPEITFKDAMSFYDNRMKTVGWTGDEVVKETDQGSMGLWYDSNLKTGLVFLYIEGTDAAPSVILVIFGN